MRSARTLPQGRRYWRTGAAGIAALLFVASSGSAQSRPAPQSSEFPWAQELNKYPGLLPELGQLFANLKDNVQMPAPRSESRLLSRLPESTMFFVAFPNYGDTARQTLEVFHQELQGSEVLRDWWSHGDRAIAGPKIEDFLDKFYQVHQYLGEEIVVSGALQGQVPSVFAVAEIRKPGLRNLLEQIVAQWGGESKAGVRVLDRQGLAIAKPKVPGELTVLVLPEFVVAAEDLAALRSFGAALDGPSRGFLSTPFGQRVTQEYRGGLTILAAADLQTILVQSGAPTTPDSVLERSGFSEVKYAIWEHKGEGRQAVSQAELSFTGPRRGPAAWLAGSGPLPSLDFVSPNAMVAGAIMLANPAQIFDEVKRIAGPSSNPFALLAAGEKALNLSVRDDLLGSLGGELTLELDSLTPPKPVWKAMLSVRDAARLEHTLAVLLTAAHYPAEPAEQDGVHYQTVHIPSSPAPVEVSYAFVDGYLVVGSNRQAVAESVRLHRSGGSLAKSAKFQSSPPAGHSLNASALLYQDPVAIAALQMQRFSPELAATLVQAQRSGEITPSVACLYGEESAIREAGSNGAFDVGATLVVAAIAIPNLLRSRMAANEASALGSLRTVNTAQVAYAATYPQRGFALNLATLGPDPRGPHASSPEHAGLLDATLASARCTGDAWCTKSGYRFRVTSLCELRPCKQYLVVATPVDSNTGTRSFCSTSDGLIRSRMSLTSTSPVTLAECKAWPPIQ